MCGRFALESDAMFLQRLLDLQGGGANLDIDLKPRYNIAPSQPIAAVGSGRAFMARWGLIPSWASDARIGRRMFNARAETLFDKPSFRESARRRRCIVPMTGYYEWSETPGGKQPYFIRRADRQTAAAAGIWDEWQGKESCAVITTEANAAVQRLHHRMPVLLEEEHWALWLNDSTEEPSLLSPLLKPSGADLEAYAVSRRVNSPVNDDRECMEPAAESDQGGLF